MKKNLIAALTASSVAVMAMGATMAAYADLVFDYDSNDGEIVQDAEGTYQFSSRNRELRILKPEGFNNWRDGLEEIKSNENWSWFTLDFIKKVSFSDEITSIPAHAFEGLTNFYDVELGYNVTEIGERAFAGCTNLGRTEKLESRPGAGDWFRQVHSVNLENGNLTTIGESAFEGCTGLMDISMPYSLTTIGNRAFANCTSLGMVEEFRVTDDGGTETVTYYAHELGIGSSSSLKSIGESAFYNCSSLAEVHFPYSLETIGKRAFEGCKALYQINLRDCNNLKIIDELSFFNCITLTKIEFPISYGYFDQSAPKHTIKKWAFRNCPWLEGVILSQAVGDVEDGAFYKCKSLKYIGYLARKVDSSGNITGINADVRVGEYSTQDKPVAPSASVAALNDGDKSIIYAPPEVTVFAFGKVTYDDIMQMVGPYPDNDAPAEEWTEWNAKFDELRWMENKYRITIKQTSNDGTNYIPEKFEQDTDICSVRLDSEENETLVKFEEHYVCPTCGEPSDFVDESWGNTHYCTRHGQYNYVTCIPYYEFTEPDGYEMIGNILAEYQGGSSNWDDQRRAGIAYRTPRSSEDVVNPKKVDGSTVFIDVPESVASGGNIIRYLKPGIEDNDSEPTSSEPDSSDSSEPESSDSSSEPTSSDPTPSNPPPYIPPINDDDPIEPDPDSSDDSSDPESSEPESSDDSSNPESSDPGSNEPTSSDSEDESDASKPTDIPHNSSGSVGSIPNPPDDNPSTGVQFFVPMIFAGAAIVVVATKRRKMK